MCDVTYADLIGVPFKNRGRDIRAGFDCYGLVMEVYRRHGMLLPEFTADYDDCDKVSHIIHGQTRSDTWQHVSAPLPVPCVVAIRFGVPAPLVNHTGVYIGDGKFIHIREKTGVCIESIHSIAWKHAIAGFFIYKGSAV